MTKRDTFLESGILELYVLGLTSEQENLEVKEMCVLYPDLEEEINAIAQTLLVYAKTEAKPINETIKPLIMATIDYTERLKNGEKPSFPPEMNKNSKLEDYSFWLNHSNLNLLDEDNDIEVKIIGQEPRIMTAIVRINKGTPYEIHDKEFEKFLVLEGSCDIVTDTSVHSLTTGDYYCVPLNLGHTVKVTSKIPCKVILQRVAA